MARRIGIRRRLTLAILVTALIPVLVAVWLAETTVRQTSARFFVPEVGARLDRSVELYQELAHAVKAAMRSEAEALAANETLRRAAAAGDKDATRRELERVLPEHPSLVSLTVRDGDTVIAEVSRGRPLDARTEHGFSVVRALSHAVKRSEKPLPPAVPPASDDRPEAPRVEEDEV